MEKYHISTRKQPICCYHNDKWIEKSTLPKKYCSVSACFHKEAGNNWKDICGNFHVDQFDKIEKFCLTIDDFEASSAMQKSMIQASEEFYKSLGFSYRVVCLVSGELNDAAVKKYDLEAW